MFRDAALAKRVRKRRVTTEAAPLRFPRLPLLLQHSPPCPTQNCGAGHRDAHSEGFPDSAGPKRKVAGGSLLNYFDQMAPTIDID